MPWLSHMVHIFAKIRHLFTFRVLNSTTYSHTFSDVSFFRMFYPISSTHPPSFFPSLPKDTKLVSWPHTLLSSCWRLSRHVFVELIICKHTKVCLKLSAGILTGDFHRTHEHWAKCISPGVARSGCKHLQTSTEAYKCPAVSYMARFLGNPETVAFLFKEALGWKYTHIPCFFPCSRWECLSVMW